MRGACRKFATGDSLSPIDRGDGNVMAKLGDVCTIVSGTTPKTSVSEYWDGNINWITPAELNEDTVVINESKRKITKAGVNSCGLSPFPAGTVILSSRAPIGKTAIAGTEMYCNQGFKNLICSDKIHNKYLFWFLRSKTEMLNSLGRGATFKEISKSIVENIEIPLPDLPTQQRIADTLDKVSEGIEVCRKMLEKLEVMVQSRFKEMMDSAELGDETTVEKITERVKVGFVGTCEKYYTDEKGIPMIRTGNITNHGIDMRNLKYVTSEFNKRNMKSQIHNGDLLIARHGSNGQASVYEGSEAQCLNAVVIVPNQTVAKSRFLAELINSPAIKEQINRTLVGSTQNVVNTKSIANLTIRIPSLKLQEEYESYVEKIDKTKLTIQKILDKMELEKLALMQEYFK